MDNYAAENFEYLKHRVRQNDIDTVITALPDMQGRLMGKRFEANYFVEKGYRETHCCNYLLATDLEMSTVDGYQATGWSSGYGDYILYPDFSTLRFLPWLEKTALVLCDPVDHHTGSPVPHAPRNVLKQQLTRLEKLGYTSLAASELEFFLFNESYEQLRHRHYRDPSPSTPYNVDYNLFATSMDEPFYREVRNGLRRAGIEVECTKGEACAGQGEINVHCTDMLRMADNHIIIKQAVKEIAFRHGKSVTFLAKWHRQKAGSSSHIHQSLLNKDGSPAFYAPDQPYGMSDIFKNYLAGLLTYSADITFLLAPYVNSYKRFSANTFAPTKAVWSIDNRTAGYRIAGADSPGVRVECRIGGADLNPYLAFAGQLAAGMEGITGNLTPEPECKGNAYTAENTTEIPLSLEQALAAFSASPLISRAFGSDVQQHYGYTGRLELDDFAQAVTDYELNRGFERG